MKLHRFFITEPLEQGVLMLRDAALVHQLHAVLRLGEGDKVVLVDGNAREAIARIMSIAAKAIVVEVLNISENTKESQTRITLYCSLLKRENFELVVQKATEIGISAIVPIIARRTVKQGYKKERLLKIAQEAAEQSGRGRVPEIHDGMLLEDAFKNAVGVKIVFDASGEKFALGDDVDVANVALFVGPEGGWDTEEIEMAKNAGCIIATLGKFTLRAETAALVASYLAVQECSHD